MLIDLDGIYNEKTGYLDNSNVPPKPEKFKNIMDLFGEIKYPNEYNKENGVIEYKGIKDSLKKGVADITEKELKDKKVYQKVRQSIWCLL